MLNQFPWYRRGVSEGPSKPVLLPPSPLEALRSAAQYEPSDELAKAVNVALLLGQPLLLTGEPGTGKTELARSLAWQLGYGDPLKFECKSTTEARHLFYHYDTLGRFQARDGDGGKRAADYVQYNALGRAIVRTRTLDQISHVLPQPEHEKHDGPRPSVVLIDEIDKAPRDFPNDILNEIERNYFRIPELGHVPVEADPNLRPVVVLTSNAEKSLPPAFLRRCVYFHIEFPDRQTLEKIVENRVGQFRGNRLFPEALDLFTNLRSPDTGLQKPPATAELLAWLVFLKQRGADLTKPMRNSADLVKDSLVLLVKEFDDRPVAEAVVKDWLSR
jgi:MoxR-like ATPase